MSAANDLIWLFLFLFSSIGMKHWQLLVLVLGLLTTSYADDDGIVVEDEAAVSIIFIDFFLWFFIRLYKYIFKLKIHSNKLDKNQFIV